MRAAVEIKPVPRNIPEDRGLTQQDVSAQLADRIRGVTATYYGRLERGLIGHPSDEILQALAEILKMDANTWSEWLHRLNGRPPSGEQGLLPSTQAPQIWATFLRASLWEKASTRDEVWGCYIAMETWEVVEQTESVAQLWGRPIHNPITACCATELPAPRHDRLGALGGHHPRPTGSIPPRSPHQQNTAADEDLGTARSGRLSNLEAARPFPRTAIRPRPTADAARRHRPARHAHHLHVCHPGLPRLHQHAPALDGRLSIHRRPHALAQSRS